MTILLTNDDGIAAPGLNALYKEISKSYPVKVVAPESEQSAVGHAITIHNPLRVKKFFQGEKFFGHAVSGTPADCVKIAVKAIMEEPPKLVISGINFGANIGTNLIYSGTVSAATEAAILNIPSVAISLTTRFDPDFSYAAEFALKMAKLVLKNGLPDGISINVNIPAVPKNKIAGVRVVKQGRARVAEWFDKRMDPSGNTYYWMAGELVAAEEEEDADEATIKKNMVSITPIHYDMTDYKGMDKIKKWNFNEH
ncbi:MAG TPA: 5'/3'-nucleotidase SurE [Nitrospinota bacterium]|jgi:5'-nucleotidase|nr:5'/3'-nucleotidase SurE [Nitrospinota bacterium]